jgi:hypothetical protein
MFVFPRDVEACGKQGPSFSSLSTHEATQREGDGLFLDSNKTLEPACSVLAENGGNVFSGRRGGASTSSSLLESTKSL